MSAITQDFMFETDDLNDFLHVAKMMLPVLFHAGNNENLQYHNMYYDKSEKPRYWFMLPDATGKKVPKRKYVLCLTHHLSKPSSPNENIVPMVFKLNDDAVIPWDRKLKWKKSSYKPLLEAIRESISIDESNFRKEFPINGWIKDECEYDGSSGMNYKMEWKDCTPESLYISLGYTYYSK